LLLEKSNVANFSLGEHDLVESLMISFLYEALALALDRSNLEEDLGGFVGAFSKVA